MRIISNNELAIVSGGAGTQTVEVTGQKLPKPIDPRTSAPSNGGTANSNGTGSSNASGPDGMFISCPAGTVPLVVTGNIAFNTPLVGGSGKGSLQTCITASPPAQPAPAAPISDVNKVKSNQP